MHRRRWLAHAIGGAAAMSAPGLTGAQPEFPAMPVRLILGFSPGGSGDTLARTMQPEIARLLGQTLVIENRPGAGSNIASELVARSVADGTTLLLGGSFSHSVNPALFASLPYDPIKDFTPIYYIGGAPSVFVVPASLPVHSLQDFIGYARREGDKVSFGSAGTGSPGHIAGSYLNRRANLTMVHVAYKGAGDAVRDLVAGQIQMCASSVASVLPMIKAGRLRPLALTSARKAIGAPEIPTAAEAGLKDFDLDGWYGVFAPAGCPSAVVARLHAVFRQTIEMTSVREKLHAQGIEPTAPMSQAEFATFVRDDAVRWKEIVRISGASL